MVIYLSKTKEKKIINVDCSTHAEKSENYRYESVAKERNF